MLGSAMNASLAYFETFKDQPTSTVVLSEPVPGYLLDTSVVEISLDYPKFQVVGGSMNFWESVTDTVFRAEVAYFIKEPVNIRGISDRPLDPNYGPLGPLTWGQLDALAVLTGTDLRSQGLYGVPFNPQSGTIPVKNSLNWMIGFDKQIWIRPMNKKSMFFLSMQYFGKWYPDYDTGMYLAVPLPDKYLPRPNEITGEPIVMLDQYPTVKEVSTIFTGMINTTYMNGNLNPQFAMAYDTDGVFLFLPQVTYIREPFRFMLQYAGIVGQFNNFGIFRDRDQISFTFSYMLN
jgi:hypothetical protein